MLASYPPANVLYTPFCGLSLTVILRPFDRDQDIPFDYAQDRVWMPAPVAAERPELGRAI